jgi:hypothetical protein
VKQRVEPGITPDSAASRRRPTGAIKAASIVGNIHQEEEPSSATFALAQALIICSLPHTQQNHKCLQNIHLMIFF